MSPVKPVEVRLAGLRLDLLTIEDLNSIVDWAVGESQRVVIGHCNLHGLVLLHRDPGMRRFYSSADYIHIDGMPLIWWAKMLGYQVTRNHRVTYLDWFDSLMTLAAARSWKIFYLGSKPGVAARGAEILEQRYKGVTIAHHHGYFDTSRGSRANEEILRTIRDFGSDVLMVGMGQPLQERWIVDHREQISAQAILASGACIDYVAGIIPSPPRWTGRLGLWNGSIVSPASPDGSRARYLVEPWYLAPLFLGDLRRSKSSRNNH